MNGWLRHGQVLAACPACPSHVGPGSVSVLCLPCKCWWKLLCQLMEWMLLLWVWGPVLLLLLMLSLHPSLPDGPLQLQPCRQITRHQLLSSLVPDSGHSSVWTQFIATQIEPGRAKSREQLVYIAPGSTLGNLKSADSTPLHFSMINRLSFFYSRTFGFSFVLSTKIRVYSFNLHI